MSIDVYRSTEFQESIAEGVFLNHAASSPMPNRVRTALTSAISTTSASPERYFMEFVMPAWKSSRERLARLMGVPADDVALMRNTSQGLGIVADGLALEPGDNVLVAACEYPSVVFPWYAQQWRGIETRIVPVDADGTFGVDSFAGMIDQRTRVIALSWVQFSTGFRADLAAFADLARSHDIFFVVDAIQALGVLSLDAVNVGIDAVVTGSQKWLMAPHGTGGLYLGRRIFDRMRPVNVGACSVVDIGKFDPLDFDLKPNAQRYEEGSPNGLGMIGLDGAISLIDEVTIPVMQHQVMSVTRYAIEALLRKGYIVNSPLDDDRRAGIVMFSHPNHASDDLLAILRKARVFASVRSGRVRFSPHFYNTNADIDAAVDALP